MKHFAFIAIIALLLISLVAGPPTCEAQSTVKPTAASLFYATSPTTHTGGAPWKARAYVLSTSDTTTPIAVTGASEVVLRTIYQDSVNVIDIIEFRKSTAEAWAVIKRDTLDQTGGGAVTTQTTRNVILKDPVTNLIPGLKGELRVRRTYAGTVIGVTSATQTTYWDYKP